MLRAPGRIVFIPLLGMALAAAAGCEPVPEIRTYSVPKPQQLYEKNHVTSHTPKDKTGKPLPVVDRMLAALVPAGTNAWFVKIAGPKAAVDAQADAFRSLVQSLKFPNGANAAPTWTEPDGWQVVPGPASRLATFFIPGPAADKAAGLEATISSLPLNAADEGTYLLANVNRWRRQMSLPGVSRLALASDVELLELESGAARVVDLLGNQQAAGIMRRPPSGHPPVATNTKRPPQIKPQTPLPVDIAFDTPEGWRPAELDMFSQVALEAGEGSELVRVTFSQLLPAGADLLENVIRWRRQVGLAPIEAADLDAELKDIEVDGQPGHLAEAVGTQETILGVIVIAGNRAWFFKLRGPNAAAAREKGQFLELLKTIRFR